MSYLRQPPAPTATPQTVRANDREVENNAGGYVYAVDDWTRLDRFLVLGTEGGTYYVDQKTLTDDNTRVLKGLLGVDGPRVVARVIEISKAGRAVKQDYGLYALAIACASDDVATRRAAYVAVPAVCRTASTLLQFVSYIRGRRGWSRGLRATIARWYNGRSIEQLAYQMVKYQGRHGFSHRDLLRLAHVNPNHPDDVLDRDTPDGAEDRNLGHLRRELYRWAVGNDVENSWLPEIVYAFRMAHSDAVAHDRMAFARSLPREALPTDWLNDPAVWEGLLYGQGEGKSMPLTAMIRNLGNMSKCGLLKAGSEAARHVTSELTNVDRLRRARIHPMALFLAGKTYVAGRGVRGSGEWAPVSAVVDALDEAFYVAFGNVEATGQKLLVAVDSSGSMNSPIAGYPNVSARDASLAFGLVVMRTEPNARFLGFTDGSNTAEFKVAGDERLRDFERRFNERVEGRGTDCAIPFAWSLQAGFDPDAVLIWSDSETWAGEQHADQALRELRRATGKRVKVAIAATTASGYTIGDPRDLDFLQVCGFDASVPNVIADFVRGDVDRAA